MIINTDTIMDTSKRVNGLFRGQDIHNHWQYGYLVEDWIYGIDKEYIQVKQSTVGASIGIDDRSGAPIYEGDTFEHQGHKFVVEYDPDCAGYVGKGIDKPTYQISGFDLHRMTITGTIHD